MKDFYLNGVRTGGWVIRGVPRDTEHGRVYAGQPSDLLSCVMILIYCDIHYGNGGAEKNSLFREF